MRRSGCLHLELEARLTFILLLFLLYISLQYFENPAPSVRQRILHLLQLWSVTLPDEPKVREVKKMLTKQGEGRQMPTAF